MCRQAETELLPQHLPAGFCLFIYVQIRNFRDYQGQIFSLFLFLPANIPRAVVFYMKHAPDWQQ